MNIPVKPVSNSGRRPILSTSSIPTIVIITLATPTPIVANVEADEPKPTVFKIVGAK